MRAIILALAFGVAGGAPGVGGAPGALAAQSLLERTPNVEGTWPGRSGTLHFHLMHRFLVTDPPVRKVVNSPTLTFAAGLPAGVLAGLRYGSNSPLVSGEPNEWEAFARWSPRPGRLPVDVAVQGGWNGAAESADGEVVVARDIGPVRVMGGARGFSAFRGGDGAAAWLAGARLRIHRFAGLVADASGVMIDDAPELAWSAGIHVELPYTPHSLSLHASNASTTTAQGASVGRDDVLWGFEFTVPITLSRYFGGRGGTAASSGAAAPGAAAGRGAQGAAPMAAGAARQARTVVVEMDNRLQFLPDTVRVRAGDTVLWRNSSALVHTVTADPRMAARPEHVRLPEGAAPFDSGDIVPGAEFSMVFEVPGEYRYFCIPHAVAGMTGTVIVEP